MGDNIEFEIFSCFCCGAKCSPYIELLSLFKAVKKVTTSTGNTYFVCDECAADKDIVVNAIRKAEASPR